MIRRHIEPVSLYGCKLMGFTNIKNARHRFSLFSFLTIAENLTSLFANIACFSELKKTTRSRSWSWQSILRYTIICYKCKNSQDAVSARSVPCSSPRITRFCHPPRVGILLWGSARITIYVHKISLAAMLVVLRKFRARYYFRVSAELSSSEKNLGIRYIWFHGGFLSLVWVTSDIA